MPVCKICSKLIKPLGMPVCLVEQMEVFLTQIVKDVNYEMGDDYYKYPPRYSVPAVPLVVEFMHAPTAVIVWKAPCNLVKKWTYHG